MTMIITVIIKDSGSRSFNDENERGDNSGQG